MPAKPWKLTLSAALALACLWPQASAGAQQTFFALHDGDRVVFYGDSITEQQWYTRFVELYTLTRFPRLNLTYIMSGVSGDKVSGGGGGPIDQRLTRDVFALKPSVVTIMLGMNDGYYRPYDQDTMTTFEMGYAHLLDETKTHLPNARVVVVRPSPYDEITRSGKGVQGYNSFLIRMGDSISRMAEQRHMAVTDFNAPVVAALTSAAKIDSSMAPMLIADHVHPGPGIHWVMADALLRGWNAPAMVTSVTLDGAHGVLLSAANSKVSEITAPAGDLKWSQLDAALPLPLPMSATEPVTALALRASTVVNDLDRQFLVVKGISPGRYELSIDGNGVGGFSSEQLAAGINLATLDTPMWRQAMLVYLANDGKISLDTTRNHLLRNIPTAENDRSLAIITAELEAATAEQRRLAQPVLHKFALVPLR